MTEQQIINLSFLNFALKAFLKYLSWNIINYKLTPWPNAPKEKWNHINGVEFGIHYHFKVGHPRVLYC